MKITFLSAAVAALAFVASAAIAGELPVKKGRCPLTIDFLGNGVEITPYAESTASFDFSRTGKPEKTAWVTGKDDALVLIKTDKGYDFFGGSGLDGFTDMRNRIDANKDNVIDAKDPAFANLTLWIDADHNGTVAESELHSFTEYSVAAIELATTDVDIRYPDAYISKAGHTVMTTGSTRNTYAVFYTAPEAPKTN